VLVRRAARPIGAVTLRLAASSLPSLASTLQDAARNAALRGLAAPLAIDEVLS